MPQGLDREKLETLLDAAGEQWRSEVSSALKEAIWSLPEREELIVRYAYFVGMSDQDVARELELPGGAEDAQRLKLAVAQTIANRLGITAEHAELLLQAAGLESKLRVGLPLASNEEAMVRHATRSVIQKHGSAGPERLRETLARALNIARETIQTWGAVVVEGSYGRGQAALAAASTDPAPRDQVWRESVRSEDGRIQATLGTGAKNGFIYFVTSDPTLNTAAVCYAFLMAGEVVERGTVRLESVAGAFLEAEVKVQTSLLQPPFEFVFGVVDAPLHLA